MNHYRAVQMSLHPAIALACQGSATWCAYAYDATFGKGSREAHHAAMVPGPNSSARRCGGTGAAPMSTATASAVPVAGPTYLLRRFEW